MVLTIIVLLVSLKLLHQVLFFLYLFQLKEYRLDRLKEHLRRVYKTRFNVWFHLTIGAPIDSVVKRLPKPSAKAILLIFISLVITTIFYIIEPTLVVMSIFFSPSIVLFSWFTILPFELLYKKYMFRKAKNKIESYKKNHKLVVIGITGSYGKTTTKTFVTAILQSKFSVITTPKSINTPVGIARIILNNLMPSHSFFIVELGAYKLKEIEELCQMTKPDIGILTGISDQHLALFGSQKNIIRAKSELLENLPENGIAIINKNSEYQPLEKKYKVKEIIYYPSKDMPKGFESLNMPETAYENLEPAVILGQKNDITVGDMVKTLKITQIPQTALTINKPNKNLTIIDDTSNANTKGCLSAIKILNKEDKELKIIVMPCIIELGQKAKEFHTNLSKILSKKVDIAIFTTKDYERDIKKAWEGSNKKQLLFLEDHKQVIKTIKPFLDKSLAILLEGRIHPDIIKSIYE